jgi:hypothetical protein
MTNNINYNNLVNVDNAASLDKVYWLVEERGLSLTMLQAELGLDRAKDYCAERLAELKEKCLRAKTNGMKRVELEEKMKYWTFEPTWIEEFNDKWFEDNAWVWHNEYEYFKIQYRQTKEVLDKLLEELESKASLEEMINCGEFGAEEEVFDLGFNQIHYDGARNNGMRILTEIKYAMHLGTMDNDLHVRYIQLVKNAIARREILSCEYHKCMAYLYKWSGLTKQMKEEIMKAQAKEKSVYSPKSDVPESNAYSMSMEDIIDLKRAAEAICKDHYMTFEEAVSMLLGEDIAECDFFAGEAMKDTVDDVWEQMAVTLS